MLAENYNIEKVGYDPFLIRDGWQVAYLTAVDEHRLDDLVDMEVHEHTDEVFVALEGVGILLTADYSGSKSKIEAVRMEPGVVYNIPAGVWHNIAMADDAKVIIVEKSNTHLNDVVHRLLSPAEKVEADDLATRLANRADFRIQSRL